MSPAVTAVITTHVRPLHVHEAIDSVRAEVHEDLEIVVVDDGGALTDAGPGVRIVSGQSLGVAAARNLGLAAARGEFVIFLDDDDVALPHRIATLLSAARHADASLAFGLTRRVVAGTTVSLPPVPTRLPSSIRFADLLACNPHVNSVLARTDVLRAVGGFDEQASHFDDWSAWLRIADRGVAIRHVHDVVAEWRLHASGLSAQLLTIRAMKARIAGLFDRLEPQLSSDHAREVAMARRIVAAAEISTYDDYVDAMTQTSVHRTPVKYANP